MLLFVCQVVSRVTNILRADGRLISGQYYLNVYVFRIDRDSGAPGYIIKELNLNIQKI